MNPSIGPLQLDNPFILAPMAGIGDPPYRRLCRRGGAAMVCAEMVSANALHFEDERSRRMLATYPDEHPVSMQVFGNDPDRLAEAAQAAESAGASVVDLNCGCPVPKITRSGGGISLMREEDLFARCVSAMVRGVRVPVTVKMRLGFKRGENRAVRFARIAEDQGASAVSVHARAQEDRHGGPPDLAGLADVVRAVSIPVFGNGGVTVYSDARTMMDTAGVAGVLVGQAAIGNPFLFLEFQGAHADRPTTGVALRERFALLREHARMIVEFYGESLGMRRLRKYIPSYVRGLHRASVFRDRANRMERLGDFLDFLSEFELHPGPAATLYSDVDSPASLC
ncbi:MAG: tRNA dihydrouridine synthase DusB [Elusimicrobia bacterium]|nr:tRNA dihydrouridine synthase DusB [Elusimicrobiota bacterium]